MARGKPLKKSFYTDSGAGSQDIAMPPLDHKIQDSQSSSSDNKSFMQIPESIPEEVYKEMNEDTNTQEVEATQVEESADTVQEEVEQVEVQETEETVKPKDDKPSAAESFKVVREAKEKAERERDILLNQMMEYQKEKEFREKQYKKEEPKPVDDDIDFNIDEDGLVEGRYVKRVTNKLKNLEKQLKGYESQSRQQSIEVKIKQDFPDFESVVSKENVDMLNSQFPEIARTLSDTSDLYNKAASAYSVIKKFGIYRENPHEEDRVKALRNTQKPRPLASVSPQQGDSPLSKANAFANGLTEDLKVQLRKEMMAARKAI